MSKKTKPLPIHEFGHNRLEDWVAQRGGGAENQGGHQQDRRRCQAIPSRYRQPGRSNSTQKLGGKEHLSAIDDVGQGPRRQGEKEHWQCGCGLDQRDHERARRQGGHQPLCANAVHPRAYVRHDCCYPQRAERREMEGWCVPFHWRNVRHRLCSSSEGIAASLMGMTFSSPRTACTLSMKARSARLF